MIILLNITTLYYYEVLQVLLKSMNLWEIVQYLLTALKFYVKSVFKGLIEKRTIVRGTVNEACTTINLGSTLIRCWPGSWY